MAGDIFETEKMWEKLFKNMSSKELAEELAYRRKLALTIYRGDEFYPSDYHSFHTSLRVLERICAERGLTIQDIWEAERRIHDREWRVRCRLRQDS